MKNDNSMTEEKGFVCTFAVGKVEEIDSSF